MDIDLAFHHNGKEEDQVVCKKMYITLGKFRGYDSQENARRLRLITLEEDEWTFENEQSLATLHNIFIDGKPAIGCGEFIKNHINRVLIIPASIASSEKRIYTTSIDVLRLLDCGIHYLLSGYNIEGLYNIALMDKI